MRGFLLALTFFLTGCSDAGCPILSAAQGPRGMHRILCLGDSLTAGIGQVSFRYYVHRDLALEGHPNDMTGPFVGNNSCPTTLYCDKDNMGTEGWTMSTYLDTGVTFQSQVKLSVPDIIHILLGVNSFLSYVDGGPGTDQRIIDATDDFEEMLDSLILWAPGARVVVSSLVPNLDERWDPLVLQDFNANIQALAAEKGAHFYDAFSTWPSLAAGDFYDDLHWNSQGEQKYAALALAGIKAAMGW